MTKVIPFPNSQNSESLKEQASLWVTRMDRGLSAQEQKNQPANQAHIYHRRALDDITASAPLFHHNIGTLTGYALQPLQKTEHKSID